MVMQNRALSFEHALDISEHAIEHNIRACALYILINSQYSSNMHVNKQLELVPKLNCYLLYISYKDVFN